MKETTAGGQKQKRARRTRADWIPEIQSWRASGQDAEEYAAARGLHPRTLAWWGRLLGKEAPPQGSAASRGGRLPQFLPVRLAASSGGASVNVGAEPSTIEVVLLNGRRVRVGSEFQVGALARLLDAVEAGGRC
jgi:hypothetical protein